MPEASLEDRLQDILDRALNYAAIHAAELELALKPVRWVAVCSERQEAIEAVKSIDIDLVVLVPDPPIHWKKDAESIRGVIGELPNPPEVLCILRRPCKGPSDRLHGDRLKVKVIYESE
jgi:hypothetical protein